MYVIVKIAGKQFKIIKNQQIYIPKTEEALGKVLTFDNILACWEENQPPLIGMPFVEGVKVTAKVIDHEKNEKVIVFKKKRRKGYKKKQGHRQSYTKVLIEEIIK